MTMFTLAVGNTVEFEVKFTLNDGGVEKPFGLRLTAQRQPLTDQERELNEQVRVQEFLEARGVRMVGWIGKPALVDSDNAPVPPGKEALDALYALVGGMVSLVFAGYLQANGARGKSGN